MAPPRIEGVSPSSSFDLSADYPPSMASADFSFLGRARRRSEISTGKSVDLLHTTAGFTSFYLVTRALWFCIHSPWATTPCIRFLYVGPRIR